MQLWGVVYERKFPQFHYPTLILVLKMHSTKEDSHAFILINTF